MAGVGSITIELDGRVSTIPATCNGAGTPGTSGPAFRLALPASHGTATNQESAILRTVNSPAAFEDLGLPANLRAHFFYLRVQSLSPFEVELTFEVSALIVLPTFGFELVLPLDDRISLVRVKGQGDLEWLAAGGIV